MRNQSVAHRNKGASRTLVAVLACLLLIAACSRGEPEMLQPPSVVSRPVVLEEHGHQRVDDFFWLGQVAEFNQEVQSLLRAENDYADASLAGTADLQQQLMDEMSARLSSDTISTPVRIDGYDYQRRIEPGRQYPIYTRKEVDNQQEQTLLNVNELAQGHSYYDLANWVISPDGKRVAYAEDTTGDGVYRILFRSLEGEDAPGDVIESAGRSLAWHQDSQSLYFVRVREDTLTPYQVYRYNLGLEKGEPELIYEERDTGFSVSLHASRTGERIMLQVESLSSRELHFIDEKGKLTVFLPRQRDLDYRVRYLDGRFFILTNFGADNYRVMTVQEDSIGTTSSWSELIPASVGVMYTDMEVFKDYLVLTARKRGLPEVTIHRLSTGAHYQVAFPEPVFTARLHANPDPNAPAVRLSYTSPVTPSTLLEIDLRTGARYQLQQQKVPEFDPSDYETQRLEILTRDGVQVPVSLVMKSSLFVSGQNPLYLYAYGSYGLSSDPVFLAHRLSLLDRGVIVAIAHVRGGRDLGDDWHDAGRLLNKHNTFSDFIDVTRGLTAQGFGDSEKVIASGGSAGGLLMAVAANEAPELYRGIVARVPFVDVLTSMLDDSLPLTSSDYLEWGDPHEKEYYEYILSYSPYDQIKPQEYPSMYVTAALHDSQVPFYESLKWVTKLRQQKTDSNPILYRIDLESGHAGASDQYELLKAQAEEYAFVLNLVKTELKQTNSR